MWTDTMQISTYPLKNGCNIIEMPVGAEVKETSWALRGLLVLEPRKAEVTKRVFWLIPIGGKIEDSLLAQLKYIGVWRADSLLQTVWELVSPDPFFFT